MLIELTTLTETAFNSEILDAEWAQQCTSVLIDRSIYQWESMCDFLPDRWDEESETALVNDMKGLIVVAHTFRKKAMAVVFDGEDEDMLLSAEIYFDYCVSATGQERTGLRLEGQIVGTSATTSEECRLLAERLKIIIRKYADPPIDPTKIQEVLDLAVSAAEARYSDDEAFNTGSSPISSPASASAWDRPGDFKGRKEEMARVTQRVFDPTPPWPLKAIDFDPSLGLRNKNGLETLERIWCFREWLNESRNKLLSDDDFELPTETTGPVLNR